MTEWCVSYILGKKYSEPTSCHIASNSYGSATTQALSVTGKGWLKGLSVNSLSKIRVEIDGVNVSPTTSTNGFDFYGSLHLDFRFKTSLKIYTNSTTPLISYILD